MSINVDSIKKAFSSGDFARGNLFKVEIPYLGSTFEFQCKASSMPSATVDKVEVSYMNRKINIGGDRTYDDWSVTVYLDENHNSRNVIVKWQELVAGMGKQITGANPSEYKKTATVTQLDRNGEPTASCDIFGLFPLSVGEIGFDYDSNNEIGSFEVSFSIDYFTNN